MSRVSPLIYATVIDKAGNTERITEQSHRVRTLEYTDSEAKADRCVLTVDNFDLSNFDDQVWAHGNFIQVSWGYVGNMAPARELVITKVTGFTELKIEAKAKSVLMDLAKTSKTFANMTRSEVAKAIAEANGYTPSNYTIEDTSTRFAFITQPRISDAEMLKRLAHKQGFEFYVDQTGLHWHERNLLQRSARVFTWYRDQGRGDVLNIAVESDVTRRPAEVKRVALDPKTGLTTTETANNTTDAQRAGTGQVLIIVSDDLMSGTTLGESVPETPATPAVMSVDASVWATAATDPAAAKEEARAAFRRGQRGAVKMLLEAIGDPTMLAKTTCTVAGVGTRLTGRYYAKEVIHAVAAGNYKIKCKLVSDGTNAMSKIQRNTTEDGLPEVTPNRSKAKLGATDAEQEGKAPVNDPDNPEALEPEVILDKDGNAIGTGWRSRGQ